MLGLVNFFIWSLWARAAFYLVLLLSMQYYWDRIWPPQLCSPFAQQLCNLAVLVPFRGGLYCLNIQIHWNARKCPAVVSYCVRGLSTPQWKLLLTVFCIKLSINFVSKHVHCNQNHDTFQKSYWITVLSFCDVRFRQNQIDSRVAFLCLEYSPWSPFLAPAFTLKLFIDTVIP